MDVPPFEKYFATMDDMSASQRAFYRHWRLQYEKGNILSVAGQISYLFAYTYDLINFDDPLGTNMRLQAIRAAYRDSEPHFASYVTYWITDALVLAGKLEQALEEFPPLRLNRIATTEADRRLAIKTWMNLQINGREALAIAMNTLTRFGRENIELINEQLTIALAEYQSFHQIDLLEKWSQEARTYPWTVFNGTRLSQPSNRTTWYYSGYQPATDLLRNLVRETENMVREEGGLPRIGEGWLAETQLYYAILNAFSDEPVIHHARPEWLGRQHLDIYLPERLVAVEYQGLQHDEPVAFFGGEAAFRQTQKRDRRKKKLCEQNNVYLIYVREGYALETVIQQIKQASRSSETRIGPHRPLF